MWCENCSSSLLCVELNSNTGLWFMVFFSSSSNSSLTGSGSGENFMLPTQSTFLAPNAIRRFLSCSDWPKHKEKQDKISFMKLLYNFQFLKEESDIRPFTKIRGMLCCFISYIRLGHSSDSNHKTAFGLKCVIRF